MCSCTATSPEVCWDNTHPILSTDPEVQYLERERRGMQDLRCLCPCHEVNR